MQLKKAFTRVIAPSLLLTFAWTSGSWLTAEPASAQGIGERIQSLFQQSRPLRNASGTNSGGAVRGSSTSSNNCQTRSNLPPLRSISPATNQLITAEEQPTFWFYVPYGQADGVKTAELMIFEEDWDYFLQEPLMVPLPEKAGLVTFTLPQGTPQMRMGAEYSWHFSLVCDSENLDVVGPWVNGWVGRVEKPQDLDERLAKENAAEVYLDEGFWGEALTVLAGQPEQYRTEWNQVLQLFELDDLPALPVQTVDLEEGSASAFSLEEGEEDDAEDQDFETETLEAGPESAEEETVETGLEPLDRDEKPMTTQGASPAQKVKGL